MSTIAVNIKDTRGLGRVSDITFDPLSVPIVDSDITTGPAQSVTTDAQGNASLDLTAGEYRVTIGGKASESFLISIPNDELGYNITELIKVFRVFPHYLRKDGDTMSGPLILQPITRTQRDLMTGLVDGMMIFQSDSGPGPRIVINGVWQALSMTPDP
jgi:hypothetical protein